MRDRLALPVIGLVSTLVVLSVGFLLLGRQREIQRAYDVSALPTLNAFLNGTSAVLLTAGYVFIRLKKVTAHKTCMVMAFGVSSLFLLSYLMLGTACRVTRSPLSRSGARDPLAYFGIAQQRQKRTLARCRDSVVPSGPGNKRPALL